jgi:hypothetical protein
VRGTEGTEEALGGPSRAKQDRAGHKGD